MKCNGLTIWFLWDIYIFSNIDDCDIMDLKCILNVIDDHQSSCVTSLIFRVIWPFCGSSGCSCSFYSLHTFFISLLILSLLILSEIFCHFYYLFPVKSFTTVMRSLNCSHFNVKNRLYLILRFKVIANLFSQTIPIH